MSVSSVASTVSVGHKGCAVPLEAALDETIAALQKHLNGTQCKLREIAAFVDFKEEVKMTDELDDGLRDMCWLFDDLRNMAYDFTTRNKRR